MSVSRTRYNSVAMLFHWTIAVLIIFNWAIGQWAGWLEDNVLAPDAPAVHGFEAFLRHWTRPDLLNFHKPLGITILLLSLARLGWRLMNPPPPMSAELKAWERTLAHVVHWGFYVLMIGIPLTGWMMVSATATYAVKPVNFWGLFDWPAFPGMPTARHNATHSLLEAIHKDYLIWATYVLLALHVAGALKHQFLDKDGELGRMIPFLREPGPR